MAKEWELTEDEYIMPDSTVDYHKGIASKAQKKLLADIKDHVYLVNNTIPCLPPEYYQMLLKAFGLEGK